MTLHIFRVTVRGQFDQLDPDVRAELLAEADQHDNLLAHFSPDGTFTYEPRLQAFSFRYEVRARGDDAAEQAVATGLDQAAAYLDARGITAKRLRATATDMADLWT